MYHFENKVVGNGTIDYSRIIASWYNAGGVIYSSSLKNRKTGENWRFVRWLRSFGFLSEEEINEIRHMAEDSNLELEDNAKAFLKANPITKE
jgi:hypothetical protein